MAIADFVGGDGIIRVLAVDHRDSLRYFLQPDDPDSVPDEAIVQIKSDLVRLVAPYATGVMLEPEYSIPRLVDDGTLPVGTPFFAALESQGYLADPGAGPTTILDGWSAEAAKASGAGAAKLLLPFHPDRPLAGDQIEVASRVIDQCRSADIELALEPLFYDLGPEDDRTDIVLRTVEQFASTGAHLLKLPFPFGGSAPADGDDWVAGCREITCRCEQPWALLSAGCTFETFLAQAAAAIEGGGVGYMVGRALWGEAATAPSGRRSEIIESVVVPRWKELAAVGRAG